MENVTIYSHELEFDKVVAIVQSKLPKAKVEYNDGGDQKLLVATIKGGLFSKTKTLKINYRQRANPSHELNAVECGLTQNLAGMVNFIQSIPAQNQEMQNLLLYKVRSMNCEMPFMAEPSMNADFEAVLKAIALELDAMVFAQPNSIFSFSNANNFFLNKNLELILDTNGTSALNHLDVKVNTKYHDGNQTNATQEQIDRKANSDQFLLDNNIKLNKNLPYIESSENVMLRSLSEVIDRAYALLIISVIGEGGIEKERLNAVIADKKINSFSPREKEVFAMDQLDDNTRAYATWRYESLNVLLWALGKIETLVYPSDICNVQEVVGAMIKPSREEFENSVRLKSKQEILDELDKIYRMNWACVDARIKGQAPTGNINPSVVYERHYALNWLTRYLDQNWDNVSTDT